MVFQTNDDIYPHVRLPDYPLFFLCHGGPLILCTSPRPITFLTYFISLSITWGEAGTLQCGKDQGGG